MGSEMTVVWIEEAQISITGQELAILAVVLWEGSTKESLCISIYNLGRVAMGGVAHRPEPEMEVGFWLLTLCTNQIAGLA